MIKTIIVENDRQAAEILLSDLTNNFPELYVECICSDYQAAINKINEYNPELVFMDIELDLGKTGFDVLRQTIDKEYHVVFITSFNKFLQEAIEFLFIAYLLKPYDLSDLETAMSRYKKIQGKNSRLQKEILLQNLNQTDRKALRFGIPTTTGLEFTPLIEILYCQAKDSYTIFHLADKRKEVVSKSLKNYEEPLQHNGFYRVHDSYLVNVDHLRKLPKSGGDSHTLELSDGTCLPISRNKKEGFLLYLKEQRIIII